MLTPASADYSMQPLHNPRENCHYHKMYSDFHRVSLEMGIYGGGQQNDTCYNLTGF
jgi:hypothetical protein